MGFKVLTTVEQKFHVFNEETGEHVTCDTAEDVAAWVTAYNANVADKAAAAAAATAATAPVDQPTIPAAGPVTPPAIVVAPVVETTEPPALDDGMSAVGPAPVDTPAPPPYDARPAPVVTTVAEVAANPAAVPEAPVTNVN